MSYKYLLAVAAVSAPSALAICANDCSGNGFCNKYSACECYRNWMGNDCSERVCYFDRAFVDTPVGDLNANGMIDAIIPVKTMLTNQAQDEQFSRDFGRGQTGTGDWDEAHFYAECSGKGTCERESGQCVCFPGYEGEGCTRVACASSNDQTCSGHGTCHRLQDSDPNYLAWDGLKTQKCVCDPGYTGTKCDQRVCPSGDDPVTRGEVNKIDTIVTTADTFAIEYTDEFGQTYTSGAQSGDVSAASMQQVLRSLPHRDLEAATVTARDISTGGYCKTNKDLLTAWDCQYRNYKDSDCAGTCDVAAYCVIDAETTSAACSDTWYPAFDYVDDNVASATAAVASAEQPSAGGSGYGIRRIQYEYLVPNQGVCVDTTKTDASACGADGFTWVTVNTRQECQETPGAKWSCDDSSTPAYLPGVPANEPLNNGAHTLDDWVWTISGICETTDSDLSSCESNGGTWRKDDTDDKCVLATVTREEDCSGTWSELAGRSDSSCAAASATASEEVNAVCAQKHRQADSTSCTANDATGDGSGCSFTASAGASGDLSYQGNDIPMEWFSTVRDSVSSVLDIVSGNTGSGSTPDFAAVGSASVINTQAGTSENDICSQRGVCDYSTGICKCFQGFTGEDCSIQNVLAMY